MMRYWIIAKRVKQIRALFQLDFQAVAPKSAVLRPLRRKRIPIYPPLHIRLVKSIAEIVKAAVDVNFLAGEAVNIRRSERAAGGEQVAPRVITIKCGQRLTAADEVDDIAVSVSVVEIMRAPVAARITG